MKTEVIEPTNLTDFDPSDVELCRRIAAQMDRRHPENREDRLIITALRFLAQHIQGGISQ